MEIKELTSLEEMLPQFDLMHLMYKKMTPEMYKSFLEVMIPNNYSQVAVFENNECLGVTGIWFQTKLWCGKALEIDNFIVHPDHRSKGIGDMICKFVDEKAKAIIAPVSAKELVTLRGIDDQSLFSLNVRASLGNTQVNKDIIN